MGTRDEIANENEAARARNERERHVREATASVALEGFTVSPEQNADMAAYVRAEMTLDDVLARTNARYGRRAV